MCDSFAEVNVTAVMLSEYLGHPLQQTTPAEMRRLRGTYNAINNGEATWAQVLAAKGVAKKTEQQQQPPAGEKPVVGAEKTPAPEKPRTLAAAAEKSRQARVKLEVVSPDEPGSNG